MDFDMAFSTSWFYIQTMLWLVSVWMMVYFCFFATIKTIQLGWFNQFATTYSIINYICRYLPFWVKLAISNIIQFCFCAIKITALRFFVFIGFHISFLCRFAFFASSVLLLGFFPFFSSLIFQMGHICAFLAIISISIYVGLVFVIITKRPNFFAFGTSFRYDFFSHFNLQYRLSWLEPVSGHIPASGSLYYTILKFPFKYTLEKYYVPNK